MNRLGDLYEPRPSAAAAVNDGMRPLELFEALNGNAVDFVLIGGVAAAMHGTTRVTQDIDLAYDSHRENLERLCQVINSLHPQVVRFGGMLTPVT